MVTVNEMAQAHLVNVNERLKSLLQQRSQLEQEIRDVENYLEEASDVVREASEAAVEQGREVSPQVT